MKTFFNLKKQLTATNILILILIIFYLLDCYLPLPEGYTGYNAWDANSPPILNYILGNCGGFLKNYMAMGVNLLPHGVYRNFTCTFMHGFILHLIANVVGLYFIGNYAEKRFGAIITYIFFFVTGFTEAFITDPLFNALAPSQSVQIAENISCGASSGIFGLIGLCTAAIFFDIKSFKKISKPTIIVSAVYGVLTTYIVSFGWTTLCHNISIILGLILGTAMILPFYLLKKGKFSPAVNSTQETTNENKEENV